jgi:hypothetical protein
VAPGLLLALGACTRSGTPRPLNAEPAALSSGPVSRGPAPPTRGLPMPSLDVQWTPPMATAGDVEALAKALSGHEAAVVRLGARLSQRARAEELVKGLDPDVAHVQDAPGGLASLVQEATELPLRRAEEPGRPRYEWEGLKVDATSLQHVAGSIPDAGVLVAVDDAAVDPEEWKALPARAVGSCQAPLEALAEGQERALAELEPFLDHADAVLAQMFRAELRAILPKMREELRPFAKERARAGGESAKDWRRQTCGHALHRVVEAYVACGSTERPCEHAPRLLLQGGARVGAVEPEVDVPEDCDGVLPRDYVAEIREAGRESARLAADHLDASWIALSDRLGAVTEVHAALEDVCAPRRRRFAEEDLHTAREKLAEIGAALGSDDLRDPAATWVLEADRFHVPGLGSVQQHARYDAGPGSPSHTVVAEARALREFVLTRARCRAGDGKLPLVALVVDGDDLKASFFGYFYEEELFCAELPPLRAGSPPPPSRE